MKAWGIDTLRRLLRKRLCLTAGAVLCAFYAGLRCEAEAVPRAAAGGVPPGLLFQDDFSSCTVGAFPDEKWSTHGKNKHLVRDDDLRSLVSQESI